MMHGYHTMSQHISQTPRASQPAISSAYTPDNAPRLLVLALAFLALITQSAAAQPTISPKDSINAYSLVEQWVRDWQVPEGSENPEIESTPAAVAIVTLRLNGKVIARGSHTAPDPSPKTVYFATRQALASLDRKLLNTDPLYTGLIADISDQVLITLELSDVLVPISDSELALPGFGYTPGILGVSVARANNLQSMGPESMLRLNTDMVQSAMALANAITDDASAVLREPKDLANSGYRFYRFEPIVLTQLDPKLGPVFTHRAGRVIAESEIGLRPIKTMSTNIATHLIARTWPGSEHYGFMGTLDPITAESESKAAAPFEQALAAYALLRYGAPASNAEQRQAAKAGTKALAELAIVESIETTPWLGEQQAINASMALIALSQLQLIDILADESLNTLRLQCLEVLDTLFTPSGFAHEVSPSAKGLIAMALVRSQRLDPRDRTALASAAVAQTFEDTPPGGLVAQMPFLGWAQLELDNSIKHPGLQQMRELVWDHQLTSKDLDWSQRDLVGGIVFTTSKTPLPSWLGLRPLACISTMLGNQTYTTGTIASGEIPTQINHQIRAIRFLRQLCATDEILHMYASPDDAKWGVRRALWDQDQGIETSAMALLVLTETTRSFDQILTNAKPDQTPDSKP
tara:strand:- start:8522 stop:10432 length:1911 start_codon:yes stop_codon:yes gene_type:complete